MKIALVLVVVFVLVDNSEGKVSRWWIKPGQSKSSFQNEVLNCLKDIKEDTNLLKEEIKKANKRLTKLLSNESPYKEFQNHTYSVVNESSTWDAAIAECKTFAPGAHLVQIDSVAEWEFIKSIVDQDKTTERYWTSLNDKAEENKWVWADGTAIASEVDNVVWFQGWVDDNGHNAQPNGGTSQNCGQARKMFAKVGATLYPADDYYMSDRPCDDQAFYICETLWLIEPFYY